jgi:hypothetical protein
MATITQKWNNLATLIKAKAIHKKKFYQLKMIKVYNDYGDEYQLPVRGIVDEIFQIRLNKKRFMDKLKGMYNDKYQKYITERKITIPKFNNINVYNSETDCPVCFEKYTIPNEQGFEDENSNKKVEGNICGHSICYSCFYKVGDINNKCPICREKLDSTLWSDDEEDEEEETDESDESEMIWGNNERPTTDLFYGRRWFNVEENRIETFRSSATETNGLNDEWRTNINQMSMSNFIIRYSFNDSNEASPLLRDDGSCCIVCGIQRTPEVYAYMNTIHTDGYNFPANQLQDEGFQTLYFDADCSEPNIRCYDCEINYHLLEGHWMSM